MTKKILAMLLAILMLVSLITACESGSGTSSTEKPVSSNAPASTPASTPESTPESTGFDLSEHREVSMIIAQNTFITDYNDNTLTNRLEELLNCDLQVEVLPAGEDAKTKLQLMINGGETLPDAICHDVGAALMYEYGTGGTFVQLDEYYADPIVMPNFHAIESEDDKTVILSTCTAADGHLYALPRFNPEVWDLTPYRTYINQKWLDNLGLETPTTTDELKSVLTSFANDDPNGNGQKDEIPVLTLYADGGGYGRNVILAMINYFTYVPTSMSALSVSEDGKTVIAPQVSEGWKEAMTYLHELYEAGAIIDNSFIYGTDTTGYQGTVNWQGIGTERAPEGKSINVVGFISCGSNSGNFPNSGKDENENFLEFRMMAPVSSANHEGTSPYNYYAPNRTWFVTEDAADPAFMVHMGDALMSRELSIASRFGEEETDWTTDPTFCADWYAEHTALIEAAGYEQTKLDYNAWVVKTATIWSDNTNHFWHNDQPRYMDLDTHTYHWGTWTDPEEFKYFYGDTLTATSGEFFSEAHPDRLLPALTYLAEEQDLITDFQVLWPSTVEEWTMKFITGELDVEKDWQTYVDEMNRLGLTTYLEVSQAAYERTGVYASIG